MLGSQLNVCKSFSPAIQALPLDSGSDTFDGRTGSEILRSAIAYCEWRAGTSWRKLHVSGQRFHPQRIGYLRAVTLLMQVLHDSPQLKGGAR
jgi:hypothetical protein